MSLLDEVTTQQVVYGPDGKAYGNPAIARNAGVNQYYREDGTPYPVATPAASGMGSGDPYSQIMGQMGGATPYERIMGRMPLLQNPYAGMSGGYNNFQGGYNPNMYSNAPRAIGQLGFGGGGSGGSEPAAPSAWSSMTPAEQAAYYAANPTMATITQLGQKAFGYTGLGRLQAMMDPNLVTEQGLIAMGVNPAAYQAAKESFRASEIADMNGGFQSAVNPEAQYGFTAEQSGTPAPSPEAQYGFTAEQPGTPAPAPDTGGGGGYSASDYGGYSGSETQSSGESYANFNGGLVSNVFGPNPAGPDDGAGMLQLGEYVIKKSAVNKYGTGLLDMINNGKIPAKKMKSLLG